jgi:hypothetical protein
MVELLATGVPHIAKAKTESPGRLLLLVECIDIRAKRISGGPPGLSDGPGLIGSRKSAIHKP